MDENEDPLELERKIAQASRILSRITDQTTYERLRASGRELRAEAWTTSGRPADQGRD